MSQSQQRSENIPDNQNIQNPENDKKFISVNARDLTLVPIAMNFGNSKIKQNLKDEIKEAIKKGCHFFDIGSSKNNLDSIIELNNEIDLNNYREKYKEFFIAVKLNYSKSLAADITRIIPDLQERKFKFIFYLDYVPDQESLNEIVVALKNLIAQEKIKGWGISNANSEQIKKCNELLHLIFVKNEIYIKIKSFNKEEIDICNNLDIFFIAYPLYISKDLLDNVEIKTIFKEHNIWHSIFCACFWRNLQSFFYILKNAFKCKRSCNCECDRCCECWIKTDINKLKAKLLLYMIKKYNIFIPMLSYNELCDEPKNEISNYLKGEMDKDEYTKIDELFKYPNNNNSRIISILSIICCIFSCLFSLFVLLYNYYGNKILYDSEISGAISNMLIENFETGYFTYFRKCSSSYINQRLLKDNLFSFGKWEGTLKGCGNKDTKAVKVLKKETCDSNEETLLPISSRNIYIYKGLTICAETKGNYFDLLYNGYIVKENEECKEGKKNCGYIDTLNNKLCLDIDEECPINFIEFSDKQPENISNLNEIKGKDINLYFSKDPQITTTKKEKIISSFRIGDSYLCSIPSLYKPSIELFELDAFKKDKAHSTDCILADYLQRTVRDTIRYEQLDEVNNYMLYEENGIIKSIENSKLIEYGFDIENYKNNILYLYGRTHLGFDKECLENRKKKFNKNDLTIIFSRAEKMRIYGKKMLWNIANIGCQFLAVVTQIIEYKCTKQFNYLALTSQIFEKVAGLIVSFYLVIQSMEAISYDDPYEEIMECSDEITNDNYNIMTKKLHSAGIIILTSYVMLIIIVILNVFSLLFHIIIKLYERKEEIQKEENNNKNNLENVFNEEVTDIGCDTEKNYL